MSRSIRLLRLLDEIRRLPQPVTADRLAEETGVSVRTIYRDVDGLRAAGARIDGAPGVGYSLSEDPSLPPQTFTRLEIEALVLGLGQVRLSGDPQLTRAAETALAKTVATLPERQQRLAIHAVSQAYRYGTGERPAIDIDALREACWSERAVDIGYVDRAGAATDRRIWPLSLAYLDNALMLLAWCTMRADYRQFRVVRMVSLSVTGDSFRPRRVPMLRTYIERLSGERDAVGCHD